MDELVLRKEDASEAAEGWQERVKAAVANGGVLAFRTPTGALAGLGGIQVFHSSKQAVPWLLCSDEAARFPKDAMRLARSCVSTVIAPLAKAGYQVSNSIGSNCTGNRAFVRSLGFKVHVDRFYFPSR